MDRRDEQRIHRDLLELNLRHKWEKNKEQGIIELEPVIVKEPKVKEEPASEAKADLKNEPKTETRI